VPKTHAKRGMSQGLYLGWSEVLTYELPERVVAKVATVPTSMEKATVNDYSLCHYLSEATEVDGMRAYVEYIFRFPKSGYRQLLNNLAWSAAVPYFRERTMPLCYEDFTPSTSVENYLKKASSAIDRLVDFYRMNSTIVSKADRMDRLRSIAGNGAKGHATSHDHELRERLRDIIFTLDRKYYNGDIAWLNSFWPC